MFQWRVCAVKVGIVLLVGMSGGCASMFSGTTQSFTVRTEPAGAQVIVNGNYVGITPLHMDIHRDKDLNVVLRETGYPEKSLLLRRDFNPVAALNLVSIICWAIDLATGAMFRIEPDTLLVSMDPAAAPAPGQLFNAPPVYAAPAVPGGAAPYPSPPPAYGSPPPAYPSPPAPRPTVVAPPVPVSPPAAPTPASPPQAAPRP